MATHNILVTGASGQVGQVLYRYLVERHGEDRIIASDIKQLDKFVRFEHVDISNKEQLEAVIRKHNIKEIYHLAAILSATAEKDPVWAWNVNMTGLLNILNASVENEIEKLFFPSSIAVFGNHANLEVTGQFEVQHPTTLYGISKSAGENWCQYFYEKHGLDVRSIRYPGVIGATTLPGGGTTDYAVHIYHEALKHKHYDCYIAEHTKMPMIFMTDAMFATMDLMAADVNHISIRTSYNLQGLSFSPAEIAESIQKYIPEFTITYAPDYRQKIAENWPSVIDDSYAQNDWNWQPKFDLDRMTRTMLERLSATYK